MSHRIALSSILLAALSPAQGTAFTDNVLRQYLSQGAPASSRVVDDDRDGFPEVWMAQPGIAQVWRFDGRTGSPTIHRGSSQSRFGGAFAVGEVFQSGVDHAAIFSTAFGREFLSIVDPQNGSTGGVLGRNLPAGHTNVRWAELVQADGDPQLELVYGARGYQSGLGAVVLYDVQTDVFTTLASGVQAADEFGTAGTVVRRAGTTDLVVTSAPGADSLYLMDPIAIGAPTVIQGLPGDLDRTGRAGLQWIGGDSVAVQSEEFSFTTPGGRIDLLDVVTRSLSPFVVGQPGDSFPRVAGGPIFNQRVWFIRKNLSLGETIEEIINGQPQVAVQGPSGIGLDIARRGLFRPFPGMSTEVLAVTQSSQRSVSVYDPSGPLDLLTTGLGTSSGTSLSVQASFGPAAAGGLAFPLFSGLAPTLTPVPPIGASIALTPDSLTTDSLSFFSGWPYALDGQGKGSWSFTVPFTGAGGATFTLSFGAVVVTPQGFFLANQDPVFTSVVLQ